MPDWKALVRGRLAPLRVDPSRESDIVDELAQHVAQHHADLIASGLANRAAIEMALAPLDDREGVAAEIARADRARPVAPEPPRSAAFRPADLARELRHALRLLYRAPGFTAVALVTLALGIGANTAIFSVVHAIVFTPPPYRDAGRLVVFLNSRSGSPSSTTSSSMPDYEDWQRQATSFDEMAVSSGWTFNLTGDALPERLFGARVSGSFFHLLGTPALVGRSLTADDDRAGADEVVVLSYGVWRRLFGADRGVVGRRLMLEGRPHSVIGVMPSAFRFPSADTEIWSALKDDLAGNPRDSRFLVVAGRLKPGVTIASAQAEIDQLTAALAATHPLTNGGWRVRVTTVQDATVGDVKPALFVLLAAVGFVLLIACANVSSLVLARVSSRSRDTAIRLALGASRARIVVQLLAETLVVSLLGGATGVALAYAAVDALVALGPADVPRLDEARIDGTVLIFALVLSLAAGVVAALAPTLHALRHDPQSSLKDGFGDRAIASRPRFGALMIVVEVAFAVTLAVGGGLLLRSFATLVSVPAGFDADRVLSLKVFLTPPRYREIAAQHAFVRAALDRMAEVAGVESAAAISQLPLGDPSSTERFDIAGRAPGPEETPAASYRAISPSYFSTLKIPLLSGRAFSDEDRDTTAFVIVINDAMARRFWPDRSPIGERIRWTTDGRDRRWLTIVGVAGDVKSNGLDRPEPPAVYAPYTQRLFTYLRWTSFVVRTPGEPLQHARPIREALAKVDPNQPVYQVASLNQVIGQSVAARRFNTLLLDLFATLALALAGVGVYGTVGYWVTQRRREIGVRMALGASAQQIRLMVVGRTASLALCGVAAGIVLSMATMRGLATLLFTVSPFDPSTFAAASFLVVAAAIGAALVPACRAARLDPLAVMRQE